MFSLEHGSLLLLEPRILCLATTTDKDLGSRCRDLLLSPGSCEVLDFGLTQELSGGHLVR